MPDPIDSILAGTTDVEYSKIDTRILIFKPEGWDKSHQGGYPLIIEIHGGGFVLCSPEMDVSVCRLLSDQTNSICVSVDYVKAPEVCDNHLIALLLLHLDPLCLASVSWCN